MKKEWFSFLGLFASFGTLICCVLPVTLVMLGLGSTMALLAVKLPFLVWLSAHKEAVFIISGAMIALSAFVFWTQRNQPCPIDPDLRTACLRGRRVSKYALILSVLIYSLGAFTAF
ncbi:MAG: hypothetical protein CL676_06445 [Bdellovibrionaceae bacterium]|nr:hypothetical protein [Pseudobdellovibrionaceae bacterium]